MLVPLSIAIAAIVLCSGLAFFSGLCLGFIRSGTDEDLRPQVVAYAAMVAELEAPRPAAWTPELRARYRYQEECRRQLATARRIA